MLEGVGREAGGARGLQSPGQGAGGPPTFGFQLRSLVETESRSRIGGEAGGGDGARGWGKAHGASREIMTEKEQPQNRDRKGWTTETPGKEDSRSLWTGTGKEREETVRKQEMS